MLGFPEKTAAPVVFHLDRPADSGHNPSARRGLVRYDVVSRSHVSSFAAGRFINLKSRNYGGFLMTNPGSCSLLVRVEKQRVRVGKLRGWKGTCAVFMLCAATAMALSAETFTTMHSFTGTDGANPYVGLVQGTDGSFYGTTIVGGANGAGNVFKITPGGKLTPLYNFCSQSNCADGQYPCTVLVQGNDGNFY